MGCFESTGVRQCPICFGLWYSYFVDWNEPLERSTSSHESAPLVRVYDGEYIAFGLSLEGCRGTARRCTRHGELNESYYGFCPEHGYMLRLTNEGCTSVHVEIPSWAQGWWEADKIAKEDGEP